MSAQINIHIISLFEFSTASCLPLQCSGAAETYTRGLGGMGPISAASGAVGPGRHCDHGTVCADNFVSGHLCSALWMLLQLRTRDTKEEATQGWTDLET